MPVTRLAARSMLAVAVVAAMGLGAPQAQADETGEGAAVEISAGADAATRSVAAADPAAVKAAAVVCGNGYILENAFRLPDASNRLGTLFTYRIPSPDNIPDNDPTCAIFDNNTSGSKWMKLKLCSNWIADGCAEDSGNFSSYAGPVYRARGGCGKVYAIMRTSAGGTVLIDAIRNATNCD
ncbi:hypothetical protein B4N89_34710 [Embleya scabrispora]|uniref:Secreted protein n=1 Tax=Embleya scabrispora TaxID=159449 RepID=A0A1T3NQQ5_9ACTN|nr:hypothetical protein [Embleya scabrispora]OPC79217.1 hypothetical protein B4N89_34710 [Embleya scabrispora]